MKLSRVLKTEREKRHYTIRQFCKIFGIPPANYHGWENGGSLVLNKKNYECLRKIKEHYELSWEYLFEGEDEKLNLEKAAFFLAEHVQGLKHRGSEV